MTLNGPVQMIFQTFLDKDRLSAFTMSETQVEPKVGGAFRLFSGNVTGEFLEIVCIFFFFSVIYLYLYLLLFLSFSSFLFPLSPFLFLTFLTCRSLRRRLSRSGGFLTGNLTFIPLSP